MGLDLSTSAKLADIWITLECYYVVDLILGSIWIVLAFYCKFCAFRIILFTMNVFKRFYQRMNKPNTQNNISSISSFKNGLNNLFSWTEFYFKSKVIEGSHKGKNNVF